INSVRRELANMLSIGIITSESQNNRLYYEINQKYEHYKALKAIFTAKSVKASIKEEEDDLTKQIRELGSVKLVLFSGAFTRDTFAPVDVLIVGDVNKTKVKKFITKLEQDEGRELRYTTLDMDDYDYRIAVKDRFITDVLNAKKTVILDDDNRIKKSK
ncbi:MAG: transcriptional regulator, partial [Candidatus Saccharimonadales bacterium]|nr:transcriptional regulator [Candidatus Saccharimonadales bacterium]